MERLSEPSYFFRLSAYQKPLLDWYRANPDCIRPRSRYNEVVSFVEGGLRDLSISRTSLRWGVPFPEDEAHVVYVWLDALTNYISALGFGSADAAAYETFWPASMHLVGKDILRFHCVYWPAMLRSAGLEPPQAIHVHGFLLVGGEKMSKTRLNQIAPATLIDTAGEDGFRYHFLADQRFGPDGEFSFEGMVARYNADLANNFGNLAARVAAVVASKCGGVGPAPQAASPLAEAAARAYEEAAAAWERVAPSEALEATWRLEPAFSTVADTGSSDASVVGSDPAAGQTVNEMLGSRNFLEWAARIPWTRGETPLARIPQYEQAAMQLYFENPDYTAFWRQPGLAMG